MFWEYYTKFPVFQLRFLSIFIAGTIFVAIQGFIIYVIIHEIIHSDI